MKCKWETATTKATQKHFRNHPVEATSIDHDDVDLDFPICRTVLERSITSHKSVIPIETCRLKYKPFERRLVILEHRLHYCSTRTCAQKFTSTTYLTHAAASTV